MVTIILLLCIIALGLTTYDYMYRRNLDIINIFVTLIAMASLITLLLTVQTDKDIKVFKQNYYTLQNMRLSQDYSNEEQSVILGKAIELNKKIIINKTLCNNKFFNLWYSKEIGDLPLLK